MNAVPTELIIVLLLGVMVVGTLWGLIASGQNKDWGWFGGIIGGWLLGLGWLVGWIYVFGPRRNAASRNESSRNEMIRS